MTVLTVDQIVGRALPSLAPAPVSGGPAGAGLGGAIQNDWSAVAVSRKAKEKVARREAIRAAVKKADARPQTKMERIYAQAGKSSRDTGSLKEREATRGSVAKAIEKMVHVPTDKMWIDPSFRTACEKLRGRYPGRSLAAMLEIGEHLTASMNDDPIAAREQLLAAYARLPIRPEQRETEQLTGMRGNLRRAQQLQRDMEELRDYADKYGTDLPDMVRQLEALDAAMVENPHHASARIAARAGAPAIQSEVPAYQAAQARKTQAAHLARRHAEVHRGVKLAIEHGHIPGDTETLQEIAAVMGDPRFQHSDDGLETLQRAARIVTHPNHQKLKAAERARNEAGTKSISGGPGRGHLDREHGRDRGTGGIRDSIARVRAAM
jgi:hypothetical protein